MAEGVIQYAVSLAAVHSRYLGVRMTLPASAEARTLSLPAWIPGSYLIRDFARHLVGMTACQADGMPVTLQPLDQQRWLLPATAVPVHIDYLVYGNDFSVRTTHVDSSHAFFNGTSAFLRVHGAEDWQHTVHLDSTGAPEPWRVATTLPVVAADDRGFGQYAATDYESLIDYPVEIGAWREVTWLAGEVPHRLVVNHAHPQTDLARIATDLAEVCATVQRFWGEVPFKRYLFLLSLDGKGYGGLEHRDSTALIFPREDLPRRGETGVSAGYQRFLSLCAHEYFHAWLVKRIRPAAFVGLPLAAPATTRLLWLFEGFTSYFDDYLVLKAGKVSPTQYLTALAETINRAVRGKGWHRQTLEESSFYAWTRFYQQDENAVNAIVSYYTRGALLALMLDLTLRLAGESLAARMRQIWQIHREMPVEAGEAIERLLGAAEYPAVAALLAEGLRSTRPMAFVERLAEFGVTCTPIAEMPTQAADWGATIGGEDLRVARVQLVHEDRPAARAGLVAGDEIVALDGFAVGGADFLLRSARYQPGDTVCLDGFRQGRLMRWTLQLEPPVCNQWRLALCDDAGMDEAMRARRAAWLAGA
ncbi:M61 family metallopeptidase [Halothiobacillus sp. DCM-1]|uniref:M61 family metallopeptidase n=1 Tax=Halothiobacillus sp. DCM-1 TaxID=3112558 RepID=UPI0032436D80